MRIMLLLISVSLRLTISPTLKSEEYASMSMVLCFKLSAEFIILDTSSTEKIVGSFFFFFWCGMFSTSIGLERVCEKK